MAEIEEVVSPLFSSAPTQAFAIPHIQPRPISAKPKSRSKADVIKRAPFPGSPPSAAHSPGGIIGRGRVKLAPLGPDADVTSPLSVISLGGRDDAQKGSGSAAPAPPPPEPTKADLLRRRRRLFIITGFLLAIAVAIPISIPFIINGSRSQTRSVLAPLAPPAPAPAGPFNFYFDESLYLWGYGSRGLSSEQQGQLRAAVAGLAEVALPSVAVLGMTGSARQPPPRTSRSALGHRLLQMPPWPPPSSVAGSLDALLVALRIESLSAESEGDLRTVFEDLASEAALASAFVTQGLKNVTAVEVSSISPQFITQVELQGDVRQAQFEAYLAAVASVLGVRRERLRVVSFNLIIKTQGVFAQLGTTVSSANVSDLLATKSKLVSSVEGGQLLTALKVCLYYLSLYAHHQQRLPSPGPNAVSPPITPSFPRLPSSPPRAPGSPPLDSAAGDFINLSTVTLRASTNRYLSRCPGCVPAATAGDVISIDASSPSAPEAKFTVIRAGTGTIGLRADNGMYITRCLECFPSGSRLGVALQGLPDGVSLASHGPAQLKPVALWEGQYAFQTDTGLYLARISCGSSCEGQASDVLAATAADPLSSAASRFLVESAVT
eukprot:jgi/Mesvir1/18009/Mv09342-RA.1